jgi:hypothetical protein
MAGLLFGAATPAATTFGASTPAFSGFGAAPAVRPRREDCVALRMHAKWGVGVRWVSAQVHSIRQRPFALTFWSIPVADDCCEPRVAGRNCRPPAALCSVRRRRLPPPPRLGSAALGPPPLPPPLPSGPPPPPARPRSGSEPPHPRSAPSALVLRPLVLVCLRPHPIPIQTCEPQALPPL